MLMLFFFFSAWRIASPVCRRAVRSQVLYLCSPGTTEIPRSPANHKVSQRLSQHFPGGSGRDFSSRARGAEPCIRGQTLRPCSNTPAPTSSRGPLWEPLTENFWTSALLWSEFDG